MVGALAWGIVGCGWVARDYVAPAIRAARNATLLAACDPDPAARAGVEAPHAHADLAAFLATPGLGAVYIAAPNHLHRALVEAAALARRPVLCEKPMATTLEDAAAMVAACKDVPYATAFDQRFHPAHRTMAALVADGAIGRPIAVRIVYACWVGAAWAADNWRVDPARAGGGALMDLAPHGLDLASMVLHERLADIVAMGQHRVHDYPVEDGAMVIARSESGVLVQLHVAYNHPETLPRRRFEIVGTDGMIVANDTMGQTPGGALTLTDAAGVSTPVAFADDDPFTAQIEAFSQSVLDRAPFAFTPAHDLRIMELLMRAQHDVSCR